MTTTTLRLRGARSLLAGTALLALSAVLTGCGSSAGATAGAVAEPVKAASPTTYHVDREATIRPGDPVPRPTGRVVLTLRNVPTTNVGKTLQLDLETLDRMGVASYEVFDRQAEGRDVRFSGPLLKDVLAVAGVTSGTLHCLALNDYDADVPVSDATKLPVLLATRADGKRMSVAHYGPTRFIYPTKGYDLDETVYDPRWVWQLKAITLT